LYETLTRRKTTRAFDPVKKTKFEDLATLLQYVFGCQGHFYLTSEVLVIHRTSPSGGCRHPIEVYPLALRVDGLDPGLYHYDVKDHALELVAAYDLEEAEALAIEIAGGQVHAGAAHVLFIMTARFFRNYWKYRKNSRTYGVILMDVAHLSQTFYLVAEDLNLGAFFSAALNAPQADRVLGVDGYTEGAVAVCACGAKVQVGSPDHGLDFNPYIPRKTKL
jgi:SagB-type dehydrogenase family enzyme